jgi:alpha-tubulin suppressor-like RCC1 family protein
VACGEAHVLAIDGDGKESRNMLWAWGQYKNGQLGLGEVNLKLNPRPVQSLSSGKINKIACGSAHSLALLGDASNVTTLSPNYYAANETLSNSWSVKGFN